jgi:dTDP-4-dehydrorhamnose reductase
VIHPGLTLFKKWEQSLSNGQPIFAFKDMTLSPVNIDDVIKKIDRLVKDKATGIFQLSGGTDKSYYKFAQEFAKRKGYPSNLVKKDSWVNKLQFTPPKYTSLLNV